MNLKNRNTNGKTLLLWGAAAAVIAALLTVATACAAGHFLPEIPGACRKEQCRDATAEKRFARRRELNGRLHHGER